MTAPIDYTAVLADLEAKRGQIDAAIAVIRALVGESGAAPQEEGNGDEEGQTKPSPASSSVPQRNTAIQSDTFFRLSTSAAVKKFLGMAKRPQTPRMIADALRAGGQVHATDEKTAYTNVYTALKRGQDKDFVQTRTKDWGLVEWYGSQSKGDGE